MPRKTNVKTNEKRGRSGKGRGKERDRVVERRVTRRMSALAETDWEGSGEEKDGDGEEGGAGDDEGDGVDTNIQIIGLLKELDEIGNQSAKRRVEAADGYRSKIIAMQDLILQQLRVTALDHVRTLQTTVQEAIAATHISATTHAEVDDFFQKKRDANERFLQQMQMAVQVHQAARAVAWGRYTAGGQNT